MAETPLLSSLREPPVVGRFYMVPVIEGYPWHNRIDDWPVIGAKHSDAEFFNFPAEHYHLDARFLSGRQAQFVSRHGNRARRWHASVSSDLEIAVSGYPLNHRDRGLPKGRPELRRRRCRSSTYRFGLLSPDERVSKMQAHFGEPAGALLLKDGRALCPHRKVDLSQFPADEQGIVTCPLHGLRVRCRVPA